MRLSNRRRGATVELQMTSMIDVTFLLLIFFMVTASFHRAERELDPQVKVNRQAPQARPQPVEPAIIDLVETSSGFAFRLGGREFAHAEELIAVLVQLDNKSEGAIVNVPPTAPYEFAVAAIQACKTAGYVQVSYEPITK